MTLLSTAYLPPVEWFYHLNHSTGALLEAHSHYIKQTYRNRAIIASANALMDLSLPIEKTSGVKQHTKDIRISNHYNWQHLHWHAIVSAYNTSPYFEYYRDDFEPIYQTNFTFLWDLNETLIHLLTSLLDIDAPLTLTDDYTPQVAPPSLDYRMSIHPKHRLQPQTPFTSQPYYQVFSQRHGFQPNLSAIDLLFNMGNEALLYL